MTHEEYKQQLTAWAGLTEKRLAALCDEYLPQQSELGQAARYSLLGGGKRVRAVLTLAVCQLAGADAADALDYACALEMLHCYSLIHDDMPCMDNDDFRRGRPSCHKQFGEATALLAADALVTAAFEVLAHAKCSAESRIEAVQLLAKGGGDRGMLYGQELDKHFETVRASEQELMALHAHKTGRGAKATRAMGAERFAYLERCADRSAALRREAALKKLPKAKKEALCAGWEEKNLPRLSVASRADAKDILELYNWYVLHHTATFQVTPSTLEEYEDWVDNTLKVAPLLLARDADGRLLGYACAHRWHPREAYDWSVESTIYCAPDARGCGVGTLLYRALLELLAACGYWNVYALVADPNPASERIHAQLGFSCVGRTPHTAYKFGWLGLSTWWLALRTGNEKPAPVRRVTAEQTQAVLCKYGKTE